MDFFYDGQIRRYVTQFMRVFIGFKYKAGDGEERQVPVMYGDMTRQVAAIIKENSENKMISVPKIACYITGLELDTTRLSDATFVSKVNIRERRYTVNDGERDYQNDQGAGYTVERLMPTPFKLTMKADIWTSNTDQKLQLLEQILVLFNPSLELQTTDNFIDWTSLSVLNLNNLSFSSRTVPAGADSEIDICSIEFNMPIYITPPAKVKKLGIVQAVISNVFTEQGDIIDLNDLIFNPDQARGTLSYPIRESLIDKFKVLLFKSDNGQPYDYDVTMSNPGIAAQRLDIPASQRIGSGVNWESVLDLGGGYRPGARIYFKQPNGYEIVGTFVVNPLDPSILVATFDQDTIPSNTLIASTINGISSRGTVDAIIDPYKYNPVTTYNGKNNIPLGIRFLMLDNVNNSENVGGSYGDTPYNELYDGPDAWKNMNGTDPVIKANSIIEWNGSAWITIWDPSENTLEDASINGEDFVPTYVQNLRTGIKYRWDGEQWIKAFEGEYNVGYWGINLTPA